MTTRNHPFANWLLVACVVIQGLGMAVLRAAGSGHYHAGASPAPVASDVADAEDGAVDRHAHATVEHHHHDADDSSVVAVQSDSTGDGCGGVSKRQIADLGMLARATAGPAATARDGTWSAAQPCAFASHVTPPLERPPRPRG